MTWQYRFSGHMDKFVSLENCLDMYGIPFKKSLDLGALLASGIKMEDIPKDELEAYLIEDVKALQALHQAQKMCKYECDMDYILPLAEMELNGMKIDKDKAMALLEDLTTRTTIAITDMQANIKRLCEWQNGDAIIDEDFTDLLGTKSKHIKAMSARTTSFLLTGSPNELTITPKWRVVYKLGRTPALVPGNVKVMYGTEVTTAHLGFPMGEEELTKIGTLTASLIPWKVLNYRKDSKLLGTYVGPFVYTTRVQGTIHPKLNTTTTGTGRLSSSAPNGQNIPPKARELVVPRDLDSLIIEMDFSQLEMLGVACVAGDMDLQEDLMRGVDVHAQTAESVFGKGHTDEDRRAAKAVNFGLLYGGKANGLSKQTGVDKDIVQRLINNFYKRYPRVGKWQTEVFNEVVSTMETHKIQGGEQTYKSLYIEPFSKRRFMFTEVKSPKWLRRRTGRGYSFSPQQTSNYPIQGFAGGDLVMYALTHLWRKCREHCGPDVKFIMTVHDSIIMEVSKYRTMSIYCNDACTETERQFKLPIPLNYKLKFGTYWQ
jgi:DNA polymerase I-like protein with 3'-5' exonuclease and polymerase domains